MSFYISHESSACDSILLGHLLLEPLNECSHNDVELLTSQDRLISFHTPLVLGPFLTSSLNFSFSLSFSPRQKHLFKIKQKFEHHQYGFFKNTISYEWGVKNLIRFVLLWPWSPRLRYEPVCCIMMTSSLIQRWNLGFSRSIGIF